MFPQGKTFLTSIIADCEFLEPTTGKLQSARDRLLVECLRPDLPKDHPIASEYPLVLGPEGTKNSICVRRKGEQNDRDNVIAHANMWLRKMLPESQDASFPQVRLAFVGNVATDRREQGKGWMKALLAEVERRALIQSADAIVLWSDLADFYQKMGFTPSGKELRVTLSTKKLCEGNRSTVWVPEGYHTGKLPQDLIRRIFELRSIGFKKPFFQVERSVHEFSELLKIPDLALFVGHGATSDSAIPLDQRPIDFFFMVGKGADMQGVIHEWGCTNIRDLMGAAGFVAQKSNLEEIMILVPPALEESRLAELQQSSTRVEQHAMVWVKALKPETRTLVDRALRDGFIWGLDSI
jgi:hypothetical protein